MPYVVRKSDRPAFPAWVLDIPSDLIAVGADLSPEVLTEAYQKGIFPWNGDDPIRWYCPDPRMILEPSAFRVSRTLQKIIDRDRFEIRYDSDYRGVMEACMTTPRPGQDGTWITPRMIDSYERLYELGVAHSVESYDADQLVGGLYGLTFGSAFFGESMFAHQRDASKVALAHLCRKLEAKGFDFIDCQQETDHLASLGARAIPRKRYLRRLARALRRPSFHYSWNSL